MHRSPSQPASLCIVALLGLFAAIAGPGPVAHAQSGPVCTELVRNGGFESAGDWELGATAAAPQYVSENRHSGNWSLLLGIGDGVNRQSFSSARQLVTVPSGVQSVTLSFWFYAIATGAPTTDYMELVLLAPDGSTVLEKPWFSRNDSRIWNRMDFDLTPWQGRTFYLYFNVYNDGLGGMARMYLDDVSLLACPGGGGSVVTPPAVITPPGVITPPIVTVSPGGPTPTRDACPNPLLPCQGTRTPQASAVAPTAAAPSATPLPPPTATPVIITPDISPVFPTSSPQVVTPDLTGGPIVVTPAGEAPLAEAPAAIGTSAANLTRIALPETVAVPTLAATRTPRPGTETPTPTPTPTSRVARMLNGITEGLTRYWWIVVIALLIVGFMIWFSNRNSKRSK